MISDTSVNPENRVKGSLGKLAGIGNCLGQENHFETLPFQQGGESTSGVPVVNHTPIEENDFPREIVEAGQQLGLGVGHALAEQTRPVDSEIRP